MRANTLAFSLMWLLVSFLMLASTFAGILFGIIPVEKITAFSIFIGIIMMATGIFFVIFNKNLTLYISNYKRKKEV